IFVEEREAAGGDGGDGGGGGGGGGVFANKTSGFLISDDLRMVPNVAGSVMRTLGNLGVSDTEGAELRVVTFGFNEIMDLLKGSLLSSTPLTDIVLGKQPTDSASAVSEPAVSTREPTEKETTSVSKKVVNLKLMVQESTNKLLFAQAESDFVNFLSSLLAIPLGGAEYLLGSRNCFKSIDNLHGSIVDIIDAKYLATPYMKSRLTKPMLAYGYMSENRILPLGEERKIVSPTVGYEPETLLCNKIEKETESNSKKKMNLKLMVQESTNKLLFAQADDDFVDFLFTLLTVPLGGVLDCVLGSHTNGLKSIDNLYRSVKTLIDDKYFLAPDTKTRLMKPKLPRGFMSKNPILPLSEEESVHWLYYNCNADKKEWLSYSDSGRKIRVVYPKGQSTDFVKGPTMYMVSDDLTVKPLSMSYSISFLNEMKIPLSDIKEVEVQIGLQEAISILKASLTSTSALTDGLMINPVSNKTRKLEH
ncbi:hypothetical protein MIMGU_mgv1a0195141mg, partial [Erythranthe guttata]